MLIVVIHMSVKSIRLLMTLSFKCLRKAVRLKTTEETTGDRRRTKLVGQPPPPEKKLFYPCQLRALTYSLTLHYYVSTLCQDISLSETPLTLTVECCRQHLTFLTRNFQSILKLLCGSLQSPAVACGFSGGPEKSDVVTRSNARIQCAMSVYVASVFSRVVYNG